MKNYISKILKVLSIENFRVYNFEEKEKKILTKEAVSVTTKYRKELQTVFTIYSNYNYIKENFYLEWEELRQQNKKMKICFLYMFLSDAQIIPAQFTVDQFIEICARVIVTQDEKLRIFFNEKLIKIFAKITNLDKNAHSECLDYDPGIFFHDFIIILSRIASVVGKHKEELKLDFHTCLDHFYRKFLLLRTNDEVESGEQPFQPKTSFLIKIKMIEQFKSKKSVVLGNLNDPTDNKNPTQIYQNIKKMDLVFRNEKLTKETTVEFLKNHFPQFMSECFYNEQIHLSAPQSSKKDEKTVPEENVKTLGIQVPSTKVKKNPLKNLQVRSNKKVKKIEFLKHVEQEPTKNYDHLINFARRLNIHAIETNNESELISKLSFCPDLIFNPIQTTAFENDFEHQNLFNSFIINCQLRNFELSQICLIDLWESLASQNKLVHCLEAIMHCLKGILFFTMKELECSMACFEKSIRSWAQFDK